ncbi:pitrilysin family protein [Pedobacter heparinus]|uniref:M16 family metallopeptidase n=1 Tax=Pedobacter heparinus TaxID=984 RepID=UPI00292CBB1B|nr:pitrilysin family protein [Pedobacter heparinus]
MKRYLLATLLSIGFCQLFAQHQTFSFDVNGLKVIFRPTQKETISMRMYYRGGVTNYAPQQSGMENLALSTAATCGTKNYTVQDYHELADEYGIEIEGGSKKDFGTIGMDCIRKYFDQGWKLFTDAIVNPAFDPAEFQNEKEKAISSVFARQSNPESRIDQMSASVMFHGSPYDIDPLGTDKTLSGFTADSVKNYYHEILLNKNRMFLVVAGNITKEALEKKITAAFGTLKAKPYTPAVYEQKPLEGERLFTEHRPLATNYLSCVLNAPVLSSPDYYPFALGINALSSMLYYEVRTKQGLSYAPGATVEVQQIPYASMYVSTTQPKKAFQAMVSVYKRVLSGGYGQEFLDGMKKNYRNQYYKHQESSSLIVDDLGEAEALGGYELLENKIETISKIKLQDMHVALNKYLRGAVWVYLGDEQLGKAAFQ